MIHDFLWRNNCAVRLNPSRYNDKCIPDTGSRIVILDLNKEVLRVCLAVVFCVCALIDMDLFYWV